MNVQDKMNLARKANYAYRTGEEIMTDAEYDILLGEIKAEIGFIAYMEFIETLGDVAGDTSMGDYVLGSLEKLKCGENELLPWMKKQNIKSIFASEKIDGCSFAASYRNGKLTLCISKGDSNDGTDWTDKAEYILPTTILYTDDLDIRGEFTLTDDSHIKLGYATRRNGTVGIFNKKKPMPEKLKYVKAYVYQVLNTDVNIVAQFIQIQNIGFMTPKNKWFHVEGTDIIEERLKFKHDEWKKTSNYDIDGIVISEPDWTNENDKFFPLGKVAFKVNSEGVPAKVVDVEWELSKNRLYNPVVILEPTVINGTTITRATGNNARMMLDKEIGIGSTVAIIRSGEVIPKIVNVLEKGICMLPSTCPECYSLLVWTKDKDGNDGADLQCPNRKCGETKRVEAFVKDLGIDKVGESSLINFGIRTFDDLLSWSHDPKYKSQADFAKQLEKKMFNASKVKLMKAFTIDGVGETIFDKILNESCGGNLEEMNYMFTNGNYSKYLTEGIGERTLEKAEADWHDAWAIMQKITTDSRYEEPVEVPKPVRVVSEDSKIAGKSFLFSGTMVKKRTDMEQLVEEMGGFIASSVNKNLHCLVCGTDQWGSSTKFQKATKLNIPILTESEFWELVK